MRERVSSVVPDMAAKVGVTEGMKRQDSPELGGDGKSCPEAQLGRNKEVFGGVRSGFGRFPAREGRRWTVKVVEGCRNGRW